jgi:hypothetical protein
MSTKAIIVLAMVAGFIGGVASDRLAPTLVHAARAGPQEIRAHKFVWRADLSFSGCHNVTHLESARGVVRKSAIDSAELSR